jgi:hypothetical protein
MWQSFSGKGITSVLRIRSSQRNQLNQPQFPFDDTKMGAQRFSLKTQKTALLPKKTAGFAGKRLSESEFNMIW